MNTELLPEEKLKSKYVCAKITKTCNKLETSTMGIWLNGKVHIFPTDKALGLNSLSHTHTHMYSQPYTTTIPFSPDIPYINLWRKPPVLA